MPKFGTRSFNYPRLNNHQQLPKYTRTNQPQQKLRVKKKYNPNVSYDFCGKIGHVDDCFRLHGFPEDF